MTTPRDDHDAALADAVRRELTARSAGAPDLDTVLADARIEQGRRDARSSRPRWMTWAVPGVAAAAVVGAIAVGVTVLGDDDPTGDGSTTVAQTPDTPEALRAADGNEVLGVGGVVFQVPQGFTVDTTDPCADRVVFPGVMLPMVACAEPGAEPATIQLDRSTQPVSGPTRQVNGLEVAVFEPRPAGGSYTATAQTPDGTTLTITTSSDDYDVAQQIIDSIAPLPDGYVAVPYFTSAKQVASFTTANDVEVDRSAKAAEATPAGTVVAEGDAIVAPSGFGAGPGANDPLDSGPLG